jgi:pyrroline-5-carboxylate reductase
MKVGLIGAGNMARALARGWGEPVLVADVLADRAEALAAETGGEALPTNAEVAERADLLVLCHKPPQLEAVAESVGGRAGAVASILGGTTLADIRAAYPGVPSFRFIPSVAVEVGIGALGYAQQDDLHGEAAALEPQVLELFGRLGHVVALPESLMDVGMGLLSTSPALFAVMVEALTDAGIRHGMPHETASVLVADAMAGTAALLEAREHDTLGLRRSVTSPGGVTARALEALDRASVRAALHDALDAVLEARLR